MNVRDSALRAAAAGSTRPGGGAHPAPLRLGRAPAWWTGWVVLALSVGCSSLPPSAVPAGAEVLSGRLSVRVDAMADVPARSLSAAFDLRGDARSGQLDLTSPMGNILARASWRPGQAVLAMPDRESSFADLDALTQEWLGQSVPVAALFDWLHGRPWPLAPSRATAQGFEQIGWQVDLGRRSEGAISARREGLPAVSIQARLDPP